MLKQKFALVELGETRQYPEKDLAVYMKILYEKALYCLNPIVEDVLVDVSFMA